LLVFETHNDDVTRLLFDIHLLSGEFVTTTKDRGVSHFRQLQPPSLFP